MKRPAPPGLAALAASLGALALAAAGATRAWSESVVDAEWAQSWQDDLRFLARELPRTHPDAFSLLARDDFERAIDRLIDAAPKRSHAANTVELARLVASLGDGHSRLTLPLPDDAGFFLGHTGTPPPRVPGLLFRPLPIRLHYLADGLFVRSVHPDHREAAGARVLRIGTRSAEEAAAAVAPYVHHDNDLQLRFQLPDYLVIPEVLAAAGVVEAVGAVELTVQPPSGAPLRLRLEPHPEGPTPELVDALAVAGAAAPLYLRRTDRHFWFEPLPAGRAVYVQYNNVEDEEDESVAAFAARLFAFVDRHPVDKLILDLRWNRGGNNTLNRPLLHGLIRSAKLQRPGRLFAIIGPGTFSAAMMLAVDLERHTPVLFAGEPTGSAPNHFGDSRRLRLPRSGLTVRVSTLYWQYSDPRDERRAIDPHLRVETTSADYLSGRDPVLEEVLHPSAHAPPGPAGLAGRWQGQAALGRTFRLAVVFERRDQAWAARMEVPDLGMDAAPLEQVSVAGDALGFVLRTPEGPFAFSGRRENDHIYGAVRLGSREVPFLLSYRAER